MRKQLELFFFTFLFGSALLVPSYLRHLNDAYYFRTNSGVFTILIIAIITLISFAFYGYKRTIQQIVFNLKSLNYNRRLTWLTILLFSQITIASISYIVYYSNPDLYVIGDEIQNRYIYLSKADLDNKRNNVREIESKINNDKDLLKELQKSVKTFKKSSDGFLTQNDSLLVAFQLIPNLPGADQNIAYRVYSKNNLNLIIVFYSKAQESLDSAISRNIKELEARHKLVQNDLIELSDKGKNIRWSYLHFLSFFFREQLQPMSFFLIIIDTFKYLLWFSISILISSQFWKERNT